MGRRRTTLDLDAISDLVVAAGRPAHDGVAVDAHREAVVAQGRGVRGRPRRGQPERGVV